MLNKSHPLSRYKANSDKNKKCLMHFDTLMLGSLFLAIDTRYNFATNFLQESYLFDSIFSIIVITNRLHAFVIKEILPK